MVALTFLVVDRTRVLALPQERGSMAATTQPDVRLLPNFTRRALSLIKKTEGVFSESRPYFFSYFFDLLGKGDSTRHDKNEQHLYGRQK